MRPVQGPVRRAGATGAMVGVAGKWWGIVTIERSKRQAFGALAALYAE